MNTFFEENWQIIIGIISAPVLWFFGGKSKALAETAKLESEAALVDSETKKNNSDAVGTMQKVYNDFLTHYQKTMEQVIDELNIVKIEHTNLQVQFDNIEELYKKEIANSTNWEKLHNESIGRYSKLNKEHEKIKKLYNDLKKDLENYKKSNDGL